MFLITCVRVLAIAVLSTLAFGLIAGCGGGDSASTSSSTSTVDAVDATAFKSCILSGSVQRGAYEEVTNPSPALQQAADNTGAGFFEAGKADDGLVFFYVLDDPAAAGDLSAGLEGTIDELAEALADQVPKGVKLGSGSVTTNGPVVVGVLPFSEEKAAELSDEAGADVSDCIAEA